MTRGEHDHRAHAPGTGAHAYSTPAQTNIGADAAHVDPVCGRKISTNPAHAVTNAGHTYYFCGSSCADKFRAAPERYVSTPNAPPVGDVPQGVIYTCPMHPQIRQPMPGNCPICGMALEPEMPALDAGENEELVDFRRRFWWTLPLTVITVALAMFGHRLGFDARIQTWVEFALS